MIWFFVEERERKRNKKEYTEPRNLRENVSGCPLEIYDPRNYRLFSDESRLPDAKLFLIILRNKYLHGVFSAPRGTSFARIYATDESCLTYHVRRKQKNNDICLNISLANILQQLLTFHD